MLRWFGRFWRGDSGQDMVEYALMIALMTVAGGAVLIPVAPSVGNIASKVMSVLGRFGGA